MQPWRDNYNGQNLQIYYKINSSFQGYRQIMSERYRKIARQQEISFADPFRWDIPMAFDGVHFTQEGHRIFADKISGIIMENREQ